MCVLFSLPLDVTRTILQYVSLRDIVRLTVATNNHKLYGILTEVLQGLEYSSEMRTHNFYGWAAKKEIRLTSISILEMYLSTNLMSYIARYIHWVTHLSYVSYGLIANQGEIQLVISQLLPYLPNVHTLRLRLVANEPEPLLEVFHVLPLKSITFTITLNNNGLTLPFLLATLPFPLLEEFDSNIDIIPASMEEEGSYPLVKYINYIDTQYSHLFPNLERVAINQQSAPHSQDLSVYSSSFQQLHYMIGSSTGLATLQTALNVMPTLHHLKVTIDRPVLTLPVSQVNCYSSMRSMELHLNVRSDLIMIHFLTASCPNITELKVHGCNKLNLTEICRCVLSHCKSLTELTLYDTETATDITAGSDATQLIIDILSQEHDHLRKVFILSSNTTIEFITIIPVPALLATRVRVLSELTVINPAVCSMLQSCTSLSHLFLDVLPGDMNIQMVYDTCPAMQRLTVRSGKYGYRWFGYSHNRLEHIIIAGNFNDNGVLTETSAVSFPSLRSLTITDSIDCDSWNRMLSKCEFTIHRLTVRDRGRVEAIMDSLLHHRNFRELQYVICYEMCERLEEYSAAAAAKGRNIQFHNDSWFSS